MSDLNRRIEMRKNCHQKIKELQEFMNKTETLDNLTEQNWSLFMDHIDEDLNFLKRINEYQKKVSNYAE
jgi:hypothetical protein